MSSEKPRIQRIATGSEQEKNDCIDHCVQVRSLHAPRVRNPGRECQKQAGSGSQRRQQSQADEYCDRRARRKYPRR